MNENGPRGQRVECGIGNAVRVDENASNWPEIIGLDVKARSINIEPLNRGYMVRIGCQSFGFESADRLLSYLERYIRYPKETEKEYLEGKLF